MDNLYKEVAKIIRESSNIVFFGGAGVSTECGIPDFRSSDGLYNKKYNHNYPPEIILSHQFFNDNPDIFYDFLFENILNYSPSPNKGHRAIAELEKLGKIRAVITQNIDNLHQLAGSKNVIELHGSLREFYCTKCHKDYESNIIENNMDVPLCSCGGVIRPNIVLYEESLDEHRITKSIEYINNADVLIIAGTSLTVYPAAGFIKYFKGRKLIIINRDKTEYDNRADIIINEPFSQFMTNLMLELGIWNFKTRINNIDGAYKDHPTFKNVSILPILAEDKGLGIRSQYAKLGPGGEISPHTHDIVEVFTVIKGKPHILLDGDWCQVSEGSTIVAYPGEVHGVRNNTDNDIIIVANFKC